jgi:beta-lactam-binding protein with PASTA domain
MKTIRMTAIVVFVSLLAGGPVAWGQAVHFNDANLKAAVEAALGKTNPTRTDMLTLTTLGATSRGIADLTGLEYAKNLLDLGLDNNRISDLSPLARLTNLIDLHLSSNQISDLSPLGGLTNLSGGLLLQNNRISDISPLVGLTSLYKLWLGENPLHPDACNKYIAQIESHGTLVFHDACWVLVPNVARMTQEDARSAIASAGLAPDGVASVCSDSAPAGMVAGTIPGVGTLAAPGSSVELVVSSGQCTVPVPNVVGMTQSDAESAIRTAHLAVGTIWWGRSETVPEGKVISQRPTEGAVVNEGSAVEITISQGPEGSATITVPNVVGMSQLQAESAITSAGLVVGTITQSQSQTVPAGQVISQNPAAGTKVAPGAAIHLTVSTGTTPPETQTAAPVAYWKLDETNGMVAFDSAGVHNGILRGNPPATWLPLEGKMGGALSFDGIDDYVTCGTFNPSAATGKLTISLWAKWNGQPTGFQGLIAKREFWGDGKTMWCIEMAKDTGAVRFFRESSVVIGGAPVLPIGQWAHVAVSFDGTTATMYINGDPTGSGPFSFPSYTEATVEFGAAQRDGLNAFNGVLDDIRLYDQALSQKEIQTLAGHSTTPPSPSSDGLAAHWKLDETQGTTAFDSMGKYNGALTGNPAWQATGGKIGGGLKFDGIDDYISIPKVAEGQELTYSLWLNQTVIGAGMVALIDTKQWIVGSVHFELRDGHPKVGINPIVTDSTDLDAPTFTLPAGEWHHVAVTKSASAVDLYADGKPAAHRGLTGPAAVILGDATIGAWSSPWAGLERRFNGTLDDIQMYTRALTESEIKTVMTGSQAAPDTNAPAPLAHWTFDETAGRTAADSAGKCNGVLTGGPVWQPSGGKSGGALKFDGSNDVVVTDFVLDPAAGAFSVFAWVKGGTAGQVIVSQDGAAGGVDWLATDSAGRLMTAPVGSGRFAKSLISDKPITDGQWHEVGLVWDGTSRTLYVDGTSVATDKAGAAASSKGGLNIGAGKNLTAGTFWSGLIDDVRIYDKAMTPKSESQPTANEADLLARWALDETAGRSAADSVGECDGILMGGPVWQPTGGKVGGALGFDGSNDVVVTDFVLDPADGPFGVFAWIKGGGGGQVIISQDGNMGGVDWLATNAAGRLTSALNSPALTASKVITDDQWHEVGLTWDGTNRTLYMDGASVATDKPAAPASSTGGLNIGAGKNLDAGTFWSGLIDDVRIYNKAVKP